MKRSVCVLVVIAVAITLVSCSPSLDADELMSEFVYSYGIDGVVYSPECRIGTPGYIYDGFTEKIFVYEGDFPENYALMLNYRADYGGECGVFVCDDALQVDKILDMCRERISLLTRGSGGLIIRSRGVIFYSTLTDSERAEDIWYKILRAYT